LQAATMSHLTKLETLFDFGFYKYATPDGAENESGPFPPPPVFPALPPALGFRLRFISARRDARRGERMIDRRTKWVLIGARFNY
jgi:hypothetical protein